MPTELSSLTELRVLDLSKNGLTGRIPTQMGLMGELCEYLQIGMGAILSVSNIANPYVGNGPLAVGHIVWLQCWQCCLCSSAEATE